MSKSSDYWKKRFELLEQSQLKKAKAIMLHWMPNIGLLQSIFKKKLIIGMNGLQLTTISQCLKQSSC